MLYGNWDKLQFGPSAALPYTFISRAGFQSMEKSKQRSKKLIGKTFVSDLLPVWLWIVEINTDFIITIFFTDSTASFKPRLVLSL